MNQSTKIKHLVSVDHLSPEEIRQLIERALQLKAGKPACMDKKYTAVNIFLENSTRTHMSFNMAELKLGMDVLAFDPKVSSLNKGETLYDTVKTFEAIGTDVAVIRHSENAYYESLLQHTDLKITIINGGDGTGQHPTQSLLDLMTIYEEFEKFNGLKVAICGDLRHSRVARSNAQLLKRLGADLSFVSPAEWQDETFLEYGSYQNLDDILAEADVLMMLRVQHERHDEQQAFLAEDYFKNYGLTVERAGNLQPHAIILHPAPVNRDVEIAGELIESAASRIFDQMKNGMFMRMAILEALLEGRQ